MELVLVRHGLPERSDATADPPLCAEGHEQAARVARWLGQEAFDVVYSSPMHRAVQTARPFAEAGGHELRTHPGIVEFDRDASVYIPMEDLKREDYPRWKAMVDGGFDTDIVGFQAMVVAALEEIMRSTPASAWRCSATAASSTSGPPMCWAWRRDSSSSRGTPASTATSVRAAASATSSP